MAVSCGTDWRSLVALPLPALWGGVDSGVFRGNTALIPSGTRVKVSLGLVIITEGDLVVEGDIVFDDPPTLPAGLALSTIALVSLAGRVVVAQNARVGGGASAVAGQSATDSAGRASATATAGEGGGVVLLSGVSLDIRGAVEGQKGGRGGDATADCLQATTDPIERFVNWLMGSLPRSATATAGGGGRGGDVHFCAQESITLPAWSRVWGGEGGRGGEARAVSANGGQSVANGGIAGIGGDVIFHGLGRSCQIFNSGLVLGGPGGWAGGTDASAGPATARTGASAVARGGDGGRGGAVRFETIVVAQGTAFLCGGSSGGGRAVAAGGEGGAWGQPPAFNLAFGEGMPGGAATARGGDGAPPGETPAIPLLPNPTPPTPGSPGVAGIGGPAAATPGKGGDSDPSLAPRPLGGPSGAGSAQGGSNGHGRSAGLPAQAQPVPALGPVGASGPTATQSGAP